MITTWYILENIISVYPLNLLICLKLHDLEQLSEACIYWRYKVYFLSKKR